MALKFCGVGVGARKGLKNMRQIEKGRKNKIGDQHRHARGMVAQIAQPFIKAPKDKTEQTRTDKKRQVIAGADQPAGAKGQAGRGRGRRHGIPRLH